MLRDRDIFIIQYTLDFFSNRRDISGVPITYGDLWPDDPVKSKAMLDGIDAELEASRFSDSSGVLSPESKGRDNFILGRIVNYMVKTYGQEFDFKNLQERRAHRKQLIDEFAHHKQMSAEYPTGEPLPDDRGQMLFVETPKRDTDTKYNKTRIYKRRL